MVDMSVPMTKVIAKSRGKLVLGSAVLGADPFYVQSVLLRGTSHQREKATLFRAAWASGVPVTAPMSQPALWNTGNVPRGLLRDKNAPGHLCLKL